MAYFDNSDRFQFDALDAGKLVSQTPPDNTDDGSWAGDPGNQAMTTQIRQMAVSLAYVDRMISPWVPRMNDINNPNFSANLLGANFGVNNNQVLRRTTCIPFQGAFSYITSQRVFDPGTALNYESLDDHVSAATFAADAAHWSPISGVNGTPEGRTEYSTYPRAVAAFLSLCAFLSGAPATGPGGYETIATDAGNVFYSTADATTNVDTIFTSYPLQLEPTQVGLPSGVGFATAWDTVVFLVNKLTDVWSAWANGGSNTVGQIKQDAQLLTFWWCAVANTSAVSGTFAQDRAGAAAEKWLPIEVGVTMDCECSDRRPATVALDPSPGGNGNMQYLMQQVGPMLRDKGYKLNFYTNDADVLNPTSTNNAITEGSIPYILDNVDTVQSIADGNNYRGNDFFADVVANYNRWRYINQDPAQGQRPQWTQAKGAITLEMAQRFSNQAWAISNVLVGAGPTFRVTIIAPGNNLPTNQYVGIFGLEAMGISGVFKVTLPNVGGTGRFVIATKVLHVDPWTGAVTTAAFNGVGLGTYLGGGAAQTGASTFKDIITTRRFIRSMDIPIVNQWRDFGEQNGDELYGPSRVITNITNANPAVVTTSTPHGLTTGVFDTRVYHDAINGMSMLNGLSLLVTIVSPTTYSLNNFDSSLLPAYAGGGIMQPTRRMMFNFKTDMLAANRGTPKMFI